mgnify:CR=1 FL=1
MFLQSLYKISTKSFYKSSTKLLQNISTKFSSLENYFQSFRKLYFENMINSELYDISAITGNIITQ